MKLIYTESNKNKSYIKKYSNRIKSRFKEAGIEYEEVVVRSQEELDSQTWKDLYLCFEPCEFEIRNQENNLEDNHTAKVIFEMILEERAGNIISILNRSELIGEPLRRLLINADFTPILIHSKTKKVKELMEISDCLVFATGKNFIIDIDVSDKLVIDIANDLKGNEGVVDYDMSDVGLKTTKKLIRYTLEMIDEKEEEAMNSIHDN